MNFKRLNNYTGWLVFIIATIVYYMTIEPTVSYWDCGEYITTSYKLEVGHPPGAPLFNMLGSIFTIFASPELVAMRINLMSALSSSFSILFLFWSITMLAKKIALYPEIKLFGNKENGSETLDAEGTPKKREFTDGLKLAVIGSGVIGALAYTFTDSFWFSAVEGEVYAMSSFFTALVFWAILKWDNELQLKEEDPDNQSLKGRHADRWLVFIFFMIGLSIGVHLLNLLAIPAMTYVYYYRKVQKPSVGGFFVTGIISLGILVLVQEFIIPKTVQLASNVELAFVNGLGLPFNSGAVFIFLAITALIVGGIMITRKDTKSDTPMIAIFGALCLFNGVLASSDLMIGVLIGIVLFAIFIFIYYLSDKNLEMALIISALGIVIGLIVWNMWWKKVDKSVLREKVRVGMNKFFYCFAMLYVGYSCFAMIVIRSNADTPLDENNPENLVSLQSYLLREQYGDWPLLYGQYFTAEPQSREKWEDRSDVYQRRFVVTTRAGKEIKGFKTEEEATTYASEHGGEVIEKYYKTFDGANMKPTFDPAHSTYFPRMYSSEQRHVDGYRKWSGHYGSRPPTMAQNLQYFVSYQVNWMYWRYFMWNFSGRQSDEQGHGDPRDGNWITGLNFIDKHHVGDQSEAPGFITENAAHNKFYMLPLILGLIGFIFTLTQATRSWWIIMLLFLMTGFATIVYLNQKPMEPRERDYAYAASFYAFAMYIGLSVLALFDAFKNMVWKDWMYVVGALAGLGLVFGISDTAASVSMLYAAGVIGALYALFILLKSSVKSDTVVASLATVILLPVPILMGMQGWDDHDRSDRYTAQALAYNYLISCDDNAVVFTNGDNDTFPLWYLQEVEGVKTSVRVCNLSLLNTDWYTEQMTRRAYESAPLPISFTEEEYRQNGHLDYLYVLGTNELTMGSPGMQEKWANIIQMKIDANRDIFEPAFKAAANGLYSILTASKFPESQPDMYAALPTFDSTNTYFDYRNLCFQILSRGEEFGLTQDQMQNIQNLLTGFNDAFDYLPADAAMAYLGDESNLEDRGFFILPAKGLTIDVDKEKVIENGIVHERDRDRIVEKMRWVIPKRTIYKADLMILDIVAHFNWDRPVYFAASAGPSTYMGLTKYFYSEGLVYKLVPIEVVDNRNPNSLGEVNEPKMYENLMETFKWGNMDKEHIWLDHTNRIYASNYRVQFSVLADAYIEEIEKETNKIKMLEQIQAQEGPEDQVVQTPLGDFRRANVADEIAKSQAIIDSASLKVSTVLDRSFEVMPEHNLPFRRVIPSYVSSYFAAGNEEKGELYANRMLDIYEDDINYYLSVQPEFGVQMVPEFFDAYRGVFSIYQAVSVYTSKPEYQKQVEARFVDLTNRIQAGLNPMRREKPNGNEIVAGTFDRFFAQYQQLYFSLGIANF